MLGTPTGKVKPSTSRDRDELNLSLSGHSSGRSPSSLHVSIEEFIMIKLSSVLLGSAALLFANFAGAQGLSLPSAGVGMNAGAGISVMPMRPSAPTARVGITTRSTVSASSSSSPSPSSSPDPTYSNNAGNVEARSEMQARQGNMSRERKASLTNDTRANISN